MPWADYNPENVPRLPYTEALYNFSMNRKIVIVAVAIIAVGISAGFVLREQAKQPANNALTAADEKLMRTPQGVIPMPPEAMRAMENANKRRP